ncbi:hypothetical protein ADUPG1_013294 [Aduncisulcus paluster]|uniref:Uncharacterized protein n=1 Tax=Aduncisulcus paluster TaxID=2918883 RepID=A0ABQ5K2E7_9EUKA|nr:hypothetical protein ADUPG1_013294 [Aduncisulcus paluster]
MDKGTILIDNDIEKLKKLRDSAEKPKKRRGRTKHLKLAVAKKHASTAVLIESKICNIKKKDDSEVILSKEQLIEQIERERDYAIQSLYSYSSYFKEWLKTQEKEILLNPEWKEFSQHDEVIADFIDLLHSTRKITYKQEGSSAITTSFHETAKKIFDKSKKKK